MAAHFPSVDRNHLISNASKALLDLKCPSTWNCESRDGDNDFGFDLEIQVAPEGQVCHTFRGQLKGTESPTFLADGKTLTIPFRRTTLNLYANTLEPVMLLAGVVTLSDDGKINVDKSRMYWQWAAVEIQRLRGSPLTVDESMQETVSIHFPLSNELTPSIDIVPYLREKIEAARATETLTSLLRGTIDTTSGAIDNPIQRLLNIVKTDPIRFQSLLSQNDEEIEASTPEGSPQKLISEAASHLRAGKTSLAEEIVSQLAESIESAPAKIQAELRTVEGKIAIQRMRRGDALRFFDEAYRLNPSEKHLLAREEVCFLEALDSDDKAEINAVASRLATVKSDEGKGLLVRILVSLGDVEKASLVVDGLDKSKSIISTLVLLSGQKKWAEVKSRAEDALLQSNISSRDAVALHLITSRACWFQALESAEILPDSTEIPLNGAPGINVNAAAAAWKHAESCLIKLKETGWNPNVELVAPIAAASSAVIGRQERALQLLKEAGNERPEYSTLQENLELLAINSGNYEVALVANSRQAQDHAVLVRRSSLLFQTKQYSECLETTLQVVSTLDTPCKQTPIALAMGFAAAMKLARVSEAEVFVAELRKNSHWGDFVYFAHFAQLGLDSEDKVRPLAALRDGLREFPDSYLLASNLFSNLKVDKVEAAEEVVSLTRLLRQHSNLSLDECLHLISALMTLGRWHDAEIEAKDAERRFGDDEKLMSLLAVAVEMQGKTGEAINILEKSVSKGHKRFTTLRNYLGLCLRLGRMSEAQNIIQSLLSAESDKQERIELLRINVLILAQQDKTDSALSVVHEIGKLVNPEVETEEGMYINLYMSVTVNAENISDSEKQAFAERVNAFCTRWPESTIFRKVVLPERGLNSVDDLHNMLDSIDGNSRQRLQEFQARERQAHLGELPIPFIVRPSYIFHYIGDCFTLWDVAKRSRPDDLQYHLTMTLTNDRVSEQILRKVPLLDLTALLVLNDLSLFNIIFELFPRIAVPRSTVEYISQNARGLLVNQKVAEVASVLLAIINKNISRIEQPSSDRKESQSISPQSMFADYTQLAGTSRWAVYSDDLITRMAIDAEGKQPNLCTVDLLVLAENAKYLTEVEVASNLVRLASWNVVIAVSTRYLIASLDGAVKAGSRLSASKRLDCFYAHQPFTTLARALWDIKKPAKELLGHMGMIAINLFTYPETDQDSATALWAFWFFRVRQSSELMSRGLDPLCYSLLFALRQLSGSAAQRAVGAFLKTVELVEGPELMTREKQKNAIVRLATIIGTIARQNSVVGEELYGKVAASLVTGTEDGDNFNEGYLRERYNSDQRTNTPR